MKVLVFLLVLIGFAGGLAYQYVLNLPEKLYSKTLRDELQTRWFVWNKNPAPYLKPTHTDFELDIEVPNKDLWAEFHFEDLVIPLPVENPFFFVSPNLSYDKNTRNSKFGISILGAKGEKISDIFFFPKTLLSSRFSSQELFELPLVINHLKTIPKEKIWTDIFSKDLSATKIHWTDMMYHLYLLELRQYLVGANFLKFGELKNTTKKIIELDYPNKDYKGELIIDKRENILDTFLIVSRKGNQLAEVVRKKMILGIKHQDTTTALTEILVREFKSLKYNKQIDVLGMLYLLSAWSHDKSRKDVLEELIMYLERGRGNEIPLAQLYTYYYTRYGEIYSKRFVPGVPLSKELQLKYLVRKEEIQQERVDRSEVKVESSPVQVKKKSLDEQFDNLIEKSKVRKTRKRKIIRID